MSTNSRPARLGGRLHFGAAPLGAWLPKRTEREPLPRDAAPKKWRAKWLSTGDNSGRYDQETARGARLRSAIAPEGGWCGRVGSKRIRPPTHHLPPISGNPAKRFRRSPP